jgi:hypothetical protein
MKAVAGLPNSPETIVWMKREGKSSITVRPKSPGRSHIYRHRQPADGLAWNAFRGALGVSSFSSYVIPFVVQPVGRWERGNGNNIALRIVCVERVVVTTILIVVTILVVVRRQAWESWLNGFKRVWGFRIGFKPNKDGHHDKNGGHNDPFHAHNSKGNIIPVPSLPPPNRLNDEGNDVRRERGNP